MNNVHPDAVIGENTHIWHFASVAGGARIGARCTIGQYVHIGPRVVVGDGCKIQNGAQLFEGVTLEDDVFIGPHAVFTNILTPRAFVNRRSEFRPTLVKRGASIGANATILCGITIGKYAMIGAGAVVTKDVGPYELVVGNPAEPRSVICKCGEPLRSRAWSGTSFPHFPPYSHRCHGCGTCYRTILGKFSPCTESGDAETT